MLPKFQKITLKNGFEVYFTPVNLGSNVISIDLFYKVGSRDETMGKSGIAHMIEHLNFKSTKNRPAGEFDRIVKGFGGVNNASTGFDYTHYFVKCSAQNLNTTLELYADMMANLSLKDEEFQPERQVVLEERRWRTDNNPFGMLFFRLFNNAFIYHPYHWTPIGFFKDIENWSIDDIREFHAKFYQPKNAFLMITGDTNEKTALNLAKKHFENIKNSLDLPKFHTQEPEQNGEKRAEIFYQNTQTEILALGYKIPPFNHIDQIGLTALGEYLSNGKSSLLQRILVDDLKLANQIAAYNMDLKDDGLFVFIAVCNDNVRASEVEKKLLELIEKTKKISLNKDEIFKIKNSLKSDFVTSLSSASALANLYGSFIARGDLEPLNRLKNIDKILNAKMIKEVSNRYFNAKNLTTITLRKAK